MYCLDNIKRLNYPADLVMELTKLYRYKGKDFYYEDIYKQDMQAIIKDTIERDTFYAALLLKLNINKNRLKSLLKGKVQPKNNDEIILANLRKVFELIQERINELEISSNEFLALSKRIFGNIKDTSYRSEIVEVQVNLLTERKKQSLRKKFDELLLKYRQLSEHEAAEATQLATNLYVDILNLKIFKEENDFLCLLVYYCLLFKERFNVFKHVSFYELHNISQSEFENAIVSASYNWESGFSQTSILNRVTIKMMLNGYNKIEADLNIYSFDRGIKKIDNVEGSILELGEIFTKEQIRSKNPYLSDSTINRALDNLKKLGKIRPNGTGRSATWINLNVNYDLSKQVYKKQLTIYDEFNLQDNQED